MQNHLPENLKLLCSYCPSVSYVCRSIGISRQQFTKYLSGKGSPSLSSLRKISDFFGVEESELLMPSVEFKELIALRPPLDRRCLANARFHFIQRLQSVAVTARNQTLSWLLLFVFHHR
ncbi:hypothetical protein ROLI_040180 [Roseobacter fucihabitans]|uniref:HTH cro/C1-type domain-containing protein n=1 Tax=Roseobacter fucihabitans TaxID=1537242 RepID=A0ABZ2BZZ3_9RHOB|nr:Helix-turn-helix domain protein [Roseobacter litoralis]